jgi:hypothetical protein
MNRLTHGCRSEQTILRSEDPAEYTAVIEGWFQQYDPQNPAERLLVDQTAHAQWILMRNQRRFDEVDYEKNMHFRHWTESQHHEYALALRYKTSAERAFLRWFKELESFVARVERKQRLASGEVRLKAREQRMESSSAPKSQLCANCRASAPAPSHPPKPQTNPVPPPPHPDPDSSATHERSP